mgnify:CR=1 FL=1
MIETFDNVFKENVRSDIYLLAITTNYQIGWDDTAVFEHRQFPCLHHRLSKQEWGQLDLISRTQNQQLQNKINDLKFVSATINLAVPSSIQFPHSEWKNEYYGETLFYDEFGEEIIYSSIYKPGRCVLFDGKIPHSIRPSSHVAPQYRFTLFVSFTEKNFIEELKNNS